jgi:thiol-disulfide isomerase/thioredoxin
MNFVPGRSFVSLAALILLGAIGVAVAAPPPDDVNKVEAKRKGATELEGKPAPAFKADYALNGKVTSLANLKGKVVILDFWAMWCPYCIQSFKQTKELHAKFKDKDVEFVGVTSYFENYAFDKKAGKLVGIPGKMTPTQERTTLKDFGAFHKLEYCTLLLTDKEYVRVSEAYSRAGVPCFYVIDKKGIVRRSQPGISDEAAKYISELVDKLLLEE